MRDPRPRTLGWLWRVEDPGDGSPLGRRLGHSPTVRASEPPSPSGSVDGADHPPDKERSVPVALEDVPDGVGLAPHNGEDQEYDQSVQQCTVEHLAAVSGRGVVGAFGGHDSVRRHRCTRERGHAGSHSLPVKSGHHGGRARQNASLMLVVLGSSVG